MKELKVKAATQQSTPFAFRVFLFAGFLSYLFYILYLFRKY